MGDTVGRPETVRANPEEQESNRTTATPAVDSSIAGETRHTVIEPRTRETSETVNPDDRRPEPVQLFLDLGLSGDSNLWQDGYSYRQNDRENNRNSRKGYILYAICGKIYKPQQNQQKNLTKSKCFL